MSTEITVRGSFTAFHRPERGTVHATIGYEASEMQSAYDRLANDLEAVKESVERLKNGTDAAVTWWSAAQLRTWSARPWNKDGVQLPLVHHAAVKVEVKFRDFAALSRWVGEHVERTEGLSISRVQWGLTAKRREKLFGEARTRAVHDAVTRAQQYATALGLGKVGPIAIADAGMLGASLHPEGGHTAAYLRGGVGASGDGPDVELVPEDIEVAATVDARFVAVG